MYMDKNYYKQYLHNFSVNEVTRSNNISPLIMCFSVQTLNFNSSPLKKKVKKEETKANTNNI